MPRYADVKRRTSEILDIPSLPGDKAGRWFDAFIITLIVVNTLVVVVETVGDAYERYREWFVAFEVLSLGVFAGEYALRVWSSTSKPEFRHPVAGRLRFMATPFAVLDLLAILPALALGLDLRFLRVLRILRLLKLTKYGDSFRILTNVFRSRRQELGMAAFIALLALVVLSSLMYLAEREAQPEAFSSIPAAMWWGVVTLTTTGYGDVVPVTPWGRVVGGLATVVGLAVLALPVGILASGFVQEIEARRQEGGAVAPLPDAAGAAVAARSATGTLVVAACPHCGKELPPK